MRESNMKRITSTAVLLLLLLGCSRSNPVADRPAADAATGIVTIEITGESETQTIEIPDVATGTTLEEAMRSIKEVPIKLSGSGTTAFVVAIGDRATNSTDGWTFKVDQKFANQGIGSTSLNPPTTITWSFGDFDGDE
jgi:hypothetical protein